MPRMNASAAATYCSRENSSVTLIGTPGEDRLLDRGQAFGGAGDLDQQIGTLRPRVQILGRGERRLGVVREQRRDFQRNPSVHAAGPVIDRPEQIGGLA